jgi:hypothetical protein
MKWLQNLIVFFGAILIYLHIFIHFKISSFNEFTTIGTISKENILSSVYYKLPFVFDGTTIIKPIDLKVLKDKKDIETETKDSKDSKESKELNETKLKSKSDTKKNKKDKGIYKKSYEAFPLLEPSVRFFTNNTIYELKKDKKIGVHRNLECRNFYMIHSGKIIVYCIHPKYIKDLSNLDMDKIIENDEILRVELYPNSILFVPNYWYVYIKSVEKSVFEKVQYKTILNEINFLYDKL